jgi:hypothetical protein
MVSVRERTIPTERPPLDGEVIANFCGLRVPLGQRDGSLRPFSRFSRQEPLLFYRVAPQLYSRDWDTNENIESMFNVIVCVTWSFDIPPLDTESAHRLDNPHYCNTTIRMGHKNWKTLAKKIQIFESWPDYSVWIFQAVLNIWQYKTDASSTYQQLLQECRDDKVVIHSVAR